MQWNKKWMPQMWEKAYFPLNVGEIANFKCYNLIALFMQTKGGFDHANAANENVFEFTPSITSQNALLASKTNVKLITDLVFL